MKYMLLIYSDTELWEREVGAARAQEEMGEWATYTQELMKRGAMVSGDPLESAATATTVRLRNGQRLVTDGPFAETKEVLTGYYVIEASDLDGAIAAAAMCPGARTGAMEIRPIRQVDMPMPTGDTAAATA